MVDVPAVLLSTVERLRKDEPLPDTRPLPLLEAFEAVREALKEQELYNDDTLVLLADGESRIILDAQGKLVTSPLFKSVTTPFAVLSSGASSLECARRGTPLKASCDDMAQLFGPRVPCVKVPRGQASAYLIKDQGFLVTGRFPAEVVAAAILVEKACRAELLAPKIGQLHYLNPALCAAEHAMYLASYSKHEREANDGLR